MFSGDPTANVLADTRGSRSSLARGAGRAHAWQGWNGEL